MINVHVVKWAKEQLTGFWGFEKADFSYVSPNVVSGGDSWSGNQNNQLKFDYGEELQHFGGGLSSCFF